MISCIQNTILLVETKNKNSKTNNKYKSATEEKQTTNYEKETKVNLLNAPNESVLITNLDETETVTHLTEQHRNINEISGNSISTTEVKSNNIENVSKSSNNNEINDRINSSRAPSIKSDQVNNDNYQSQAVTEMDETNAEFEIEKPTNFNLDFDNETIDKSTSLEADFNLDLNSKKSNSPSIYKDNENKTIKFKHERLYKKFELTPRNSNVKITLID